MVIHWPKKLPAARGEVAERFNARIAGRPDLLGSRTSMTRVQGMIRIMENTFLNVNGRVHSISAEVTVKAGKTNGVLIEQAGRFAGWSF